MELLITFATLCSVVFIVTLSSSTGNIGDHSRSPGPPVLFVYHSSSSLSHNNCCWVFFLTLTVPLHILTPSLTDVPECQ